MLQSKRKEFGGASASMVLLCILIGFVGIIILSNTNVLLTKMGFETTTSLKAQLVSTSNDLEQVTRVNSQNLLNLEMERENTKVLKEQLQELQELKSKASESVTQASVRKANKTSKAVSTIIAKTVETKDTITLPKEEVEQLSRANIDQLHEVYASLFTAVNL